MTRAETLEEPGTEIAPLTMEVPRRLIVPAVIAVFVAVLVLLAVVAKSESAWHLLGVGRGLVPPEYYHVSGFVIVLATTIGQAVGWAGGSAFGYYLATLVGFPRGFVTWKLVMSVVYAGLGAVPLVVYHVLYGTPLLGIPRAGLEEFLVRQYPDAHWLLYSSHPFVDGSLVPLAVVFLGFLWFTGEAPRRSRAVQTVLALALVGTSLAIALSLAIHSTFAHIRY